MCIGNYMFAGCTSLTSVTIPSSVKTIGNYAFNNSEASIHFAGTKAQWKAISLPTSKDDRLVSTTIHCVDGDIVPGEESDDENSITTGKADTRDNKRYAVFNGLTAGKSYAVIVSKSSTNPFDADNLIYVNQREAKANGVLEVPFISSETGATYVVACSDEPEQILYTATIEADGQVTTIKAAAGDTISIEAKETANDGKTFQTWKVVKGDVKLENAKSRKTTFVMATEDIKITAIYEKSASSSGDSSSGGSSSGTTKPDKPGSGSSSGSGSSGSSGSSSSSSSGSASSGGSSSSSSGSSSSSSSSSSSNNNDGGGAIVAVVLIGGAAIAAVTAGVILMMPVEVSGVAQLDDGTVLANVTVQLMKDGKLAAQTMTDESGHFALEVKRGEYTLNMITTNPETGEQIVRTASIKAPMKNTSFVF